MATIDIKELFDETRYPFGWDTLPFMLYFPFGVTLAIIRFFISFQMILMAFLFHDVKVIRRFLLKILCNVLGIVIREDFSEVRDKSLPVLVTNHVTLLDHLAFHVTCGCVTPRTKELPSLLSWALGMSDLGLEQSPELLATKLRDHLSSPGATPVLLQPEGTTTNSRVGLLKFQATYLSETNKVQPVALQLWRPPTGVVSSCVLGSSWWAELFWFFYVPCSVFMLRYLPAIKRTAKEDSESFAQRVEQSIGTRLGLRCTKFTASDKAELEKKLRRVSSPARRSPARPAPRTPSLELQRMAAQVSEVLPYVPVDVLLKDLARTRSVDLTIANILEGHIPFRPIVPPATPPDSNRTAPMNVQKMVVSTSRASANVSSTPSFQITLDTSAPTFAKSVQERTLSFTERKNRLLECARRRYIEKHGLIVAGSN